MYLELSVRVSNAMQHLSMRRSKRQLFTMSWMQCDKTEWCLVLPSSTFLQALRQDVDALSVVHR
jgi:hypothetical protein